MSQEGILQLQAAKIPGKRRKDLRAESPVRIPGFAMVETGRIGSRDRQKWPTAQFENSPQ